MNNNMEVATTCLTNKTIKNISYEEIIETRNTIEKLAKVYQLEVLRIFFNHKVYMNENQNGTLINLMDLPSDVYADIKNYIDRVKNLELTLDFDEKQKQEYKNAYFS
jgi:hypothetical protein